MKSSAKAEGPSRAGTEETAAIPPMNAPRTNLSIAATVEDVVRALENGPAEGVVIIDAPLLRAGVAVFRERVLAEPRPPSDETIFTPRQLNALFGDLTRSQQTFLMTLLRHPGSLVTHEDMAREINGGSGKMVDYHSQHQLVHELRKKLGPVGRCIETRSGIGFRWNRANEPKGFSIRLVRMAGLSLLVAVALALGIRHLGTAGAGPDAAPTDPAKPFQTMLDGSGSGTDVHPAASAGHAPGHSPWRAVDGAESTWFEGAASARKGDWLVLRVPVSPEIGRDRDRRIGILFGRPDAATPPFAPPCRVEYIADAAGDWLPLGDADPSINRFVADVSALPRPSVDAVRIVVTEDSDLPLVVREVDFAISPAE